MIEILFIVAVMLLLLLLKGFFSGSEIALVNADRLRLRHAAGQGRRGARMVLKLLRRPEMMLGTTLVGTNISLVALTTLGTLLTVRLFGEYGDLVALLLCMMVVTRAPVSSCTMSVLKTSCSGRPRAAAAATPTAWPASNSYVSTWWGIPRRSR